MENTKIQNNAKQNEQTIDLSNLVITAGIEQLCEANPLFRAWCGVCAIRHASGDWGDLCEEDKAVNREALETKDSIFSTYTFGKGADAVDIYIITDAGWNVTTILLPDEY